MNYPLLKVFFRHIRTRFRFAYTTKCGHAKKHKASCKKYKPYILKYKALISKYMPCIFRLFGPPEKQQLTKPQKCRFSALRNKARKGSRAIHHSQKFLKSTCKTFRFVKKTYVCKQKTFLRFANCTSFCTFVQKNLCRIFILRFFT